MQSLGHLQDVVESGGYGNGKSFPHLPVPQGTPEALLYPLLERMSSTSHSRAVPRYALLRPLRRAGAARWAEGKSSERA